MDDRFGLPIIKVLDVAIGKTGISLKEARYHDIDAAKIELHYPSHAGYYPGASLIHMLVIYDTISGTILGFEAIGRESIDKKADVMSVAISSNGQYFVGGSDRLYLFNRSIDKSPPSTPNLVSPAI